MVKLKRLLIVCLAAATAFALPTGGANADLPPLPEGYEDFDFAQELDLQTFIGGNTNADVLGLSCTVLSASNVADSNASITEGFQFAGLAALSVFTPVVADDDAVVVSRCTIPLTLPTDEVSTQALISNEALVPLVGIDSGIFSLKCTVGASPDATVRLKVGGGVPGRVDIVATDLSAPIPFMCSFEILFQAEIVSELHGTVEGTIDVMSSLTDTTLCNGRTTITCVPIELPDAVVTVTSASGGLEGYVGSGTFSFENQFTLARMETLLKMAGDVDAFSTVRTRAPLAAAKTGKIADLRLNLKPGSGAAQLLRPFIKPGARVATIANGQSIVAVAAPNANCAFSAKRGSGAWKAIGSKRANSNGESTLALSGTVLTKFRSTGVKVGGNVTLRVACGAGGAFKDQKPVRYVAS